MDWKLVEFVYFDYSIHILWRKLMFTSSRAHLSKLYQLMKATMRRGRGRERVAREEKNDTTTNNAQIFVRCDLRMNGSEAHAAQSLCWGA